MRSRRNLPKIRVYRPLSELCPDDEPVAAPLEIAKVLNVIEAAAHKESAEVQPKIAEVQIRPAAVYISANTPPAEVHTSASVKLVLPQKQPAEVPKHERRPASHRRINFWLDKAEKQKLQDFAARLEMTLTDYLVFAAVHTMECAEVQSQRRSAEVCTSHEDLKIFKAPDDIVMSYRELTGNKWRPADDVTSRPYWDTDRRLIECGIINTLLKTKQSKINSFAYFVPEINEVLAIPYGEEAIEAMHRRRRAQWAKLVAK